MSLQSLQHISLTNTNNMQVTLCNYGARVLSIKVPNKNGKLVETTLNHTNDEDIVSDQAYMGATCGRVANRISGAKFMCDGAWVKLEANENNNLLHGGIDSFSHRYWDIQQNTGNSVKFVLESPHGDQGFPGKMRVSVNYTLNDDNALLIEYDAQCDALCPINLCNHTYFTMGESDIKSLELQVNATKYIPVNEESIPLGTISPVSPALDFRKPQTIKDKLKLRDFDDCYVVDSEQCVVLTSHVNQLALHIESNQLGMQVYTGNALSKKYAAIALEAQGLIDAVNHGALSTDWVSPDAPYSKFVKYQFLSL
jgi:aldose 1-epimerase